jgi:hypothetical protein
MITGEKSLRGITHTYLVESWVRYSSFVCETPFYNALRGPIKGGSNG